MEKVFAVVLLNPNDGVKERLVERYPGSYEFNDTFFLSRAASPTLSQEIAVAVGLKGDDRIEDASGFVIQQRSAAYSGYTRRDLSEWLTSVEEGNAE